MKVRGEILGLALSTDKTTLIIKVRETTKIRKRYNQVPHLTQDTTGQIVYPGIGIMEDDCTPLLHIKGANKLKIRFIPLWFSEICWVLMRSWLFFPNIVSTQHESICKSVDPSVSPDISPPRIKKQNSFYDLTFTLSRSTLCHQLSMSQIGCMSRNFARSTLRDVCYNARWFWTTVRYGFQTKYF